MTSLSLVGCGRRKALSLGLSLPLSLMLPITHQKVHAQELETVATVIGIIKSIYEMMDSARKGITKADLANTVLALTDILLDMSDKLDEIQDDLEKIRKFLATLPNLLVTTQQAETQRVHQALVFSFAKQYESIGAALVDATENNNGTVPDAARSYYKEQLKTIYGDMLKENYQLMYLGYNGALAMMVAVTVLVTMAKELGVPKEFVTRMLADFENDFFLRSVDLNVASSLTATRISLLEDAATLEKKALALPPGKASSNKPGTFENVRRVTVDTKEQGRMFSTKIDASCELNIKKISSEEGNRLVGKCTFWAHGANNPKFPFRESDEPTRRQFRSWLRAVKRELAAWNDLQQEAYDTRASARRLAEIEAAVNKFIPWIHEIRAAYT